MGQQDSQTLTLIGLVVQIVLAAVAIWYAWETRRLRLSGEVQISLLREQGRSSLEPYLSPSVALFDKDKYRKEIEQDVSKNEDEKKEELKSLMTDDTIFICSVVNVSSKIALDVDVWIYNALTKSFLESDQGFATLGEKDREACTISPPYRSVEDARKRIVEKYGPSALLIASKLNLDQNYFATVIFRDIEGHAYSVRRNFLIRDGNLHHLPGQAAS